MNDLADAIPEPISLAEALALREAKLRGDDAELISGPARLAPTYLSSSKGKGKASSSRLADDGFARSSMPKDPTKNHKTRLSGASSVVANGTTGDGSIVTNSTVSLVPLFIYCGWKQWGSGLVSMSNTPLIFKN